MLRSTARHGRVRTEPVRIEPVPANETAGKSARRPAAKVRRVTRADASPDIAFTDTPGYLVRRMHQLSQAHFEAEVSAAGFDLTPVQFAALAVIAARPGLDQARIADAVAFDRATTGGVIDRLEGKGLVRRRVSKADRRARSLEAARAGVSVLAAVAPVVERVQSLLLAGLTAGERRQFIVLLAKAVAGARTPVPTPLSTQRPVRRAERRSPRI